MVAYRGEAGSGIGATREPIGRAWVRGDGLILWQEVAISNLLLTMERLPDDEVAPYAEWLEDERFLPRLPFGIDPEESSPAHD